MREPKRIANLVCTIVFTVGILLIGAYFKTNSDESKRSENFISTFATVVDHDERISSSTNRSNTSRSRVYGIIVEYEVDGTTYTRTSNLYTDRPKAIGERVEIKYNPDSPADMIWLENNGLILFLIIGAAFVVVSIIISIAFKKAYRFSR